VPVAQLLDGPPAPAPTPATRAAPAPTPVAYRELAEQLRRDVLEQRYCDGRRLPTEAELSRALGLSRQTVRRAFQELVAEGMVYRVPGRGTFARDDAGKYLRPSGSIEELMNIGADTELEILVPPTIRVDLEAAGRLRLATDEVVSITFRRFHEGHPFCVTTVHLPVPLGRGLFTIPELNAVGLLRHLTVLSVVQVLVGAPFGGADQSITAVAAPEGLRQAIDVGPGEPVLRIDRVYFDTAQHPLELAVNYFNPARYSYRLHMGAVRR
jgi:GntR family transcriptional regulator